MLEICISLASPLLALRGGWGAGIMNQHTPIMDILHLQTSFPQEKELERTIRPMKKMSLSSILIGTLLGPQHS